MNGYSDQPKASVQISISYTPENFNQLKEIFYMLKLAERPAKPRPPMEGMPEKMNQKELDAAYEEYRRKGGNLAHDPWQTRYMEYLSIDPIMNVRRHDQLLNLLLLDKE